MFWGVWGFRLEFLGHLVWERRHVEDGHSLHALSGEAQPLPSAPPPPPHPSAPPPSPAPHTVTQPSPSLGLSLIFFHLNPIIITPVTDNIPPFQRALESVSSKDDIIVVLARCVQTITLMWGGVSFSPLPLPPQPWTPHGACGETGSALEPLGSALEPLGSGGRLTSWAS